MRLLGGAVLALALCAAAPAGAQTTLEPGYVDHPVRGAAVARGAVIYSHELRSVSESMGEAPYLADTLWDAGWDVFRLQRRWAGEDMVASPLAVADAARRLRAEGYGKIVLVGQSFGGWISLAATVGAGAPSIDAVVAFAPAAFGMRESDPDREQNAAALYPIVSGSTATRILIFLFSDDPYEIEGRGDRLHDILAGRAGGALVDRPAGFFDHWAGLSRAFARRFGACIRDFIAAAPPPDFFACPEASPVLSASEFTGPRGLRLLPAPPEAKSGLGELIGRWYGVTESGREILFTVDEVGIDLARAVYAFGPIARGDEQDERQGYTRRRGEYDAANRVLSFTEPQFDLILECRLDEDGMLEFAWKSRRTEQVLYSRLRRAEVNDSP